MVSACRVKAQVSHILWLFRSMQGDMKTGCGVSDFISAVETEDRST